MDYMAEVMQCWGKPGSACMLGKYSDNWTPLLKINEDSLKYTHAQMDEMPCEDILRSNCLQDRKEASKQSQPYLPLA